jgi:hypothetical protein
MFQFLDCYVRYCVFVYVRLTQHTCKYIYPMFLSEIYIQYLEHTALYEILLRHHIIGY